MLVKPVASLKSIEFKYLDPSNILLLIVVTLAPMVSDLMLFVKEPSNPGVMSRYR